MKSKPWKSLGIVAGVTLAAAALMITTDRTVSAASPEPQQAATLSQEIQARIDAEIARATTRLTSAHVNAALARAEQAIALAQERLPAPPDRFELFVDGDSGWLGVEISEVTAEKAKELKMPGARGVLVGDVESDSPAAKAGLKAGDVITEFNSQRVEGTVQFRRFVNETPAGRTVQLGVWRDGKTMNISVQLGERTMRWRTAERLRIPPMRDFTFSMPDVFAFSSALGGPRIGIQGEDLSGQLGSYFGAPDGEGVLVREVTKDSPAEKGGLKAGDVIIKANGQRVRTLVDLREQLRGKLDQNKVNLTVLRRGSETTVSVEVEQPRPPERRRIASRRTQL